MRDLILMFFVVVLFTSCATVFNKRSVKVTVHTNEPAKIIANFDTTATVNNEITVKLLRDKKPVTIIAKTDTSQQQITVKGHSSFAYYLNFLNYGIGYFTEMNNPKRYTYPKNIYFKLNDSLKIKRNYCFNIYGGASLISFYTADAYTPEKIYPAIDLAVDYYFNKKTSLRFKFTKSAHKVDSYNLSGTVLTYSDLTEQPFNTKVEEHWWFNDYKLELLFHPSKLNWKKSGLYIPTGLGIRQVLRKNIYDPDIDDGSGIRYTVSNPDIPFEMVNSNEVVPWDSKLLILLGMGYQYKLNRWNFYFEPGLEFGVSAFLIQGGSTEHGRLRYHVSSGVGYRFGT